MPEKVYTDGESITIWWALPNAFVDPANPTAAELNTAPSVIDVTDSVAWANFSFGSQASNQTSDPAIGDVGNSQTRGFAQFGGTISFFYPQDYSNTDNEHLVTFEALEEPRTLGYVIIRIDGKKTTGGTGDRNKPAVDGDFINIYRVMSDGWSDVVTGEESFKYTITFLPQGELYSYARVGSVGAIAAPTLVGGTVTGVGDKVPASAFLASRTLYSEAGVQIGYPGAFRWASSDPEVCTVDANGVVTAVAAGEADITATWPHTNTTSAPLELTIT